MQTVLELEPEVVTLVHTLSTIAPLTSWSASVFAVRCTASKVTQSTATQQAEDYLGFNSEKGTQGRSNLLGHVPPTAVSKATNLELTV